MLENIKLFATDTDRSTYEEGDNYTEPYVSLVDGDNSVHYNKPPETRIITTFNITDTSSATRIMNLVYINRFKEIEIDGVVQPSVVSSYTFNTTGEHIIKYTLTDNTDLGGANFSSCKNMTSVIIPNSVTKIGTWAFDSCTGLTSIIIGNSVTSIGTETFYGCSSLTSIICNATTAPALQRDTFSNIKTGGTLTVPAGSTGYDIWMNYLGSYGWTKVEQ